MAITNENGCEGTSTLTVTLAPTFTSDLSSTTSLCLGESLIVATTGTTVTYQWYSSSDGSNWSAISSATSSSYTPTISQYYKVVATNTTTNCVIESAASDVTINALPSFTIDLSAVQSLCTGASVSVAATGTGTISYQWYESVDNSTWSTIASATSTSYIPVASQYYKVVATDGATNCTQESTVSDITVDAVPSIAFISDGCDYL